MRVLVEIDPSTIVGAALMKHITALHAPSDAVKIHEVPALTDEEMALPGVPPQKENLDAWLALPDYGVIDGDKALSLLKEELAEYRKTQR